jgi:dihydrolipoamide dehydrogenase
VGSSTAEFDVVVIGGGPGGYGAALYAAGAGLRVALVEKDRVGGTCLHRGCIPSKALLAAARVRRTVQAAHEFGVATGERGFDLAVAQARVRGIVDRLDTGLGGLLKRRGVVVVAGTARLERDRAVALDTGERLAAGAVVVATGSAPLVPRLAVSAEDVMALTTVPAAAVVSGGGPVACEVACLLHDLGARVGLVLDGNGLLPGCDAEVAAVLRTSFERRGIEVDDGTGAVRRRWPASALVVTTDRRPRTDGLGLDAAGVAVDARGFIAVDARMRTTAPGVYAVGDVVASPPLAHAAYAEAITAVRDMLGDEPVAAAPVAWCVYTDPEVAWAGLSEAEARAQGHCTTAARHSLRGNGRALILGEPDGLVKVVADRGADGRAGTVLGVHAVGPLATEAVGQGFLGVAWGLEALDWSDILPPHPTLGEALGEAVLDLAGRGLHG